MFVAAYYFGVKLAAFAETSGKPRLNVAAAAYKSRQSSPLSSRSTIASATRSPSAADDVIPPE